MSREEIRARVRVADWLAEINQRLGLAIPNPDGINDPESRVIEIAATGMRHGRVAEAGKVTQLITNFKGVEELVGLLGAGPLNLQAMNELPLTFRGQKIDVGPARLILENATLVDDPEDLLLEAQGWGDDERRPVNVSCSRIIHEFFRYLKEDPDGSKA